MNRRHEKVGQTRLISERSLTMHQVIATAEELGIAVAAYSWVALSLPAQMLTISLKTAWKGFPDRTDQET